MWLATGFWIPIFISFSYHHFIDRVSHYMCSYVKKLMAEAGLSIREDAMGNIYGRLEGTDADAGIST